jgi:multidrug resistance protein MdtO
MPALTPHTPEAAHPLDWLGQFFKEELAPYPGRVALLARMVTAATIVMILNMTFRIPFAAYGAIFALTISRESPRTTVSAAGTIVIAFALGAVYVLVGAIFFVSDPAVRLFWVIGTFFLTFYSLSAMSDYVAAARYGYLLVITTPLWDQHISANQRVENTLWAVAAVGLASIITALLELLFAEMQTGDQLLRSIEDRLEAVEWLLAGYAADRPVDQATAKNITRLATVGTSRQRRYLDRSTYSPQYREQMGAVVALAGRLIDIAAAVQYVGLALGDDGRNRVRDLAANLANIRSAILNHRIPRRIGLGARSAPPHGAPLLHEMETTVALIAEVLAGAQSLSAYAPASSAGGPSPSFLVPDALTNPRHLQFGLRGCLAASLSYVTYTLLFWPGISTAVTTCLLTALTTVGASHQKQLLRISGALVGGFGIGMGAQIFVLPHLDSIFGFTVLFVAVIAVSAWIQTSSSRLSYFGTQLAVAFCLINLSEFKFQTSLTVARDRVVGVLLGLSTMWLAFDQLWAAPDGVAMKKTFIANLRLLAELAREPISGNLQIAIARFDSLRERINKQFGKVRSLADGVLFEFGRTRQQDLELRSRIRRWLPQLQTFGVLRNTLIRYRLQLPGFELPASILRAQQEFDEESARMLDRMADRLEGSSTLAREEFQRAFEHLEEAVRESLPDADPHFAAHLETFLPLHRVAESLIVSLDAEFV